MKYLTTGQCAKYCQVCTRTIHNWVDTGLLKGFKIPGSNHRRIPQENLVALMEKHGIPIPDELQQEKP
jgi:excisionase family DNA binding protein